MEKEFHKRPPALHALKPILHDVAYFVPGGKQISAALRPQLQAALDESQQLLTPCTTAQAHQLVERLFSHFPKGRERENLSILKADYFAHLSQWPLDLASATVAELITTHPYPTLPSLAHLERLCAPWLAHRHKQHERVRRLLAQSISPR